MAALFTKMKHPCFAVFVHRTFVYFRNILYVGSNAVAPQFRTAHVASNCYTDYVH